MPSLAGAVSFLTLAGISGQQPYIEQAAAVGRVGYHFGGLALYGTTGANASGFFAKSLSADIQHVVSDTASLTVTETPIDSNEVVTYDTISLNISEISRIYNLYTLTDTARLVLGEAVSLVTAGVTAFTPTDTASISITDIAVLDVSLAVTDTTSISVSDPTPTVDTAGESYTATDTVSLSITDTASVNIFSGYLYLAADDTATIQVTDSAEATVSRTVDAIRFTWNVPRIVFRKL